jgi:hypothetical protein
MKRPTKAEIEKAHRILEREEQADKPRRDAQIEADARWMADEATASYEYNSYKNRPAGCTCVSCTDYRKKYGVTP